MSEPAGQPVIEMRDAQVAALRDPALVVLDHVNWTVRPGEFWIVAGPPHSGKSDLLVQAAGLLTPGQGSCRLFGTDTYELDESRLSERLRIGLTFADGKLFNQFTVAENVALPLRYHRVMSDVEIGQTVAKLLELLDLTSCANLLPSSLAVVWRQRTALARALALQPEAILLDNPNAALTARHRRWLVDFLDQLWRGHPFFDGRPLTIVVTTDDLSAWQHPRRRFAAVHEGSLSVLGDWGGDEFIRHQAVRELLAIDTTKKED